MLTQPVVQYLRDVLGIRSFLSPQATPSEPASLELFRVRGSEHSGVAWVRISSKDTWQNPVLEMLLQKMIVAVKQETKKVLLVDVEPLDFRDLVYFLSKLRIQQMILIRSETENYVSVDEAGACGIKVLAIPSLEEISSDESQKRKAWESLKTLMKANQ